MIGFKSNVSFTIKIGLSTFKSTLISDLAKTLNSIILLFLLSLLSWISAYTLALPTLLASNKPILINS